MAGNRRLTHRDGKSPSPTEKQSREGKSTRTRLLGLLRQSPSTVEDLAAKLALTDNAVRFHLAALESAGAVETQGLRRAGVGQPAVVYGLTRDTEDSFSRAYAPLLAACVAELREVMSTPQLTAFLKRVGKRIGRDIGRAENALARRVATASGTLNSLGGITVIEKRDDGFNIVGRACPLARAVESDHCVCTAVTALVAEIVDADVRERCDRTGRPKCCFEITPRRVSS